MSKNETDTTSPAERGILLTVYLVLLLLLSLFVLFQYIYYWNTIAATSPWILFTFSLIVILRILSIVAIWFFSKIGIVSFILLTIAGIPLSMSAGTKLGCYGILGATLLLVLIKPKWKYMTWGFSGKHTTQTDEEIIESVKTKKK
jgi:hypothetical protein